MGYLADILKRYKEPVNEYTETVTPLPETEGLNTSAEDYQDKPKDIIEWVDLDGPNVVTGTGIGPEIKSANITGRVTNVVDQYKGRSIPGMTTGEQVMLETSKDPRAFGRGVGRFLGNKYVAAPRHALFNAMRHHPLSGAAVGGLMAGGLGLGYGAYRKYFSDDPEDGKRSIGRYVLPAALAGGALAGLGSHLYRGVVKKGSAMDGLNQINAAIMNDPSLSDADKNSLIKMVGQVPYHNLEGLKRIATTAIGAGVGAAIAKYLMGLGFTGQVLSAIVGGVIGRSFGGPSVTRNAFGQEYMGGTDFYGNARTFLP